MNFLLQGVGKWVLLSDIPARKFSDESGKFSIHLDPFETLPWLSWLKPPPTTSPSNSLCNFPGEFLLELSLSNILTIFEVDYTVPNIQTLQRNFKIDTLSVQYGGFDWSLVVNPQESDINNDEFTNLNEETMVNVFLNRMTGHDRLVRVKYRLFLGNSIASNAYLLRPGLVCLVLFDYCAAIWCCFH